MLKTKLENVGESRDKVDYITPHVDELTPVLMSLHPQERRDRELDESLKRLTYDCDDAHEDRPTAGL